MPVVEFTVEGPPVSHQSKNKPGLVAWKAQVRAEAAKAWLQAPMKGLLKCTIMNFFEGPDADRSVRAIMNDPVSSSEIGHWIPLFDGPLHRAPEAYYWEQAAAPTR